MANQKRVVKLTTYKGVEFLLGVESIIDIHWDETRGLSKITSRQAMATTNYSIQTPEEIWEQINS
jgi:hypothetical protein